MNLDKERTENIETFIKLIDESEIASIKSVVSGVMNVINDPRSSAKDLKDIIEIDPPLTAKVLKTANFAYYSPPKEISEIQHAVIWIGFDTLKEIALSQKVCEIFERDETIHGFSGVSLWKHSIAVGLLGKLIYRREFGERGDNAYAVGLMHEIGIILEDQLLKNDFQSILDKAKNEEKNLSKLEDEVFGYNHADVGKALGNHWSFPQEFVVAIGHHHSPHEAVQEFSRITLTLYVADYLCQERGIGYCDAPFKDKLAFQECLDKLGLESYALDLIVSDMEQEILKMENDGLF
jgi:HD-like signal output (HDOD) protein